MRQGEALRLIANEEPCWLGMAVRGQHSLYLRTSGVTVPFHVWNRLLDLEDIEVVPEMFGINNQYVRLTNKGRKRLTEEGRIQ